MEIIKEGICVNKDDGTQVDYYIFPEYEIHYNVLKPHSIQQWHHHNIIEETIYIISGEIEIHWIYDNLPFSRKLCHGNVIRVENTPHTFENVSEDKATFVVFRLLLSGIDAREKIKTDKHIDIL